MSALTAGRRCAVLGHPIAHSLSPVLHRAAYAELGLDWTFERVDLTEAQLADWVAAADRRWRGLALTMPLKRAVVPLLDAADDRVQVLGAANTVLWEDDGSRRGANTDVPGLMASLQQDGPLPGGRTARTTVLGGGATAAAAVLALAELGVGTVSLRVRDPGRAAATRAVAERCGVDLPVVRLDAPWAQPCDVLVSTVPSPVAAALVPDAAWGDARTHSPPVVADVSYAPWPSPLLVRAGLGGARTVTGIDLLVHQAVAQVQLMTGRAVPVSLLRAAARASLASSP